MLLRRLVRTVPLLWWVAAITLASLTAAMTTRSLRQADAVVDRWGTTQPALVVVDAVAAGSPIEGSVVLRELPRVLVPDGALTTSVHDRLALVDLVPGEIVIESRLTGSGRSGLAAVLGDREHAITVPSITGDRPPIEHGDRVVLIGVPADGAPARVLATARALALDPETGAVTVAVSHDAVVAVAAAIERGRVVITLVP